jgi:hypothetical protein
MVEDLICVLLFTRQIYGHIIIMNVIFLLYVLLKCINKTKHSNWSPKLHLVWCIACALSEQDNKPITAIGTII